MDTVSLQAIIRQNLPKELQKPSKRPAAGQRSKEHFPSRDENFATEEARQAQAREKHAREKQNHNFKHLLRFMDEPRQCSDLTPFERISTWIDALAVLLDRDARLSEREAAWLDENPKALCAELYSVRRSPSPPTTGLFPDPKPKYDKDKLRFEERWVREFPAHADEIFLETCLSSRTTQVLLESFREVPETKRYELGSRVAGIDHARFFAFASIDLRLLWGTVCTGKVDLGLSTSGNLSTLPIPAAAPPARSVSTARGVFRFKPDAETVSSSLLLPSSFLFLFSRFLSGCSP